MASREEEGFGEGLSILHTIMWGVVWVHKATWPGLSSVCFSMAGNEVISPRTMKQLIFETLSLLASKPYCDATPALPDQSALSSDDFPVLSCGATSDA